MSEICSLCSIPDREILLRKDEEIFLVATKDAKGHFIRVMACIYEHRKEPSFVERSKAYSVIIKYMNSVMQGEEWVLVDGKYASHSDHWHLIASDLLGTPEELEALKKTPTVRMR